MANKSLKPVMIAVVATAVVVGGGMYMWQNFEEMEKLKNRELAKKSVAMDLSTCGAFPTSTGDGGPTSKYFVCKNSETTSCYLKKTYSEQKKGCSAKMTDDNPYGDDDCFTQKVSVYGFDGKAILEGKEEYRKEDTCQMTEQKFFRTQTGLKTL